MQVNLICIGAGKCGTTWLYGLLHAHSECCVSEVKETQYFENYFDRGVQWYERRFKMSKTHRIKAEVSNTYLFEPIVAQRIREYNPSAKIVVTVRNPIERALSHYLFLQRNGERLPAFGELRPGTEYDHVLWRGLYFRHLQPFLDAFPKEQIKILVHEDLVSDSERYGESVLDFSGVTPVVPDFDAARYRLPASAPRSTVAARVLKRGAEVARDLRLESLVQKVKNSAVPKLAYRRMTSEEKPVVDDQLKAQLVEYFRADTADLSEWLGRDLVSEWFQ